MRSAAFLGSLALATALGGGLVAELALLPGLENESGLVDANLAKALAAPLHLRIGEIVLAAALVLVATVPRWLDSRVATTLALLHLIAAALHRWLVAPMVYAAWSRADRVAGRPLERIVEAERLSDQAHWLAVAMMLLLAGLVWLASAPIRARAPASTQTPSQASDGSPRAESQVRAAA